MSVSSVLIENWPRLQCTNIYLTLTSDQLVQEAQLHLTQTHIRLSFNDEYTPDAIVNIPPSLCVQIDTLSQLVKQSKHLSFRLNTNRAHAFDEEYLCKIIPNTRISGHKRLTLEPCVKPNDLVRLQCTACEHWLCDVVAFQRVLELPSDNLDSADWFCHHHENGHSHSHSKDDALDELRELGAAVPPKETAQNFVKIAARPMDLLYGQFCFVVNIERLSGAKLMRNDVHCGDCYQKLGEFHGNNETVKLWNEHILFQIGKSAEKWDSGKQIPLFAGSLFTQFLFIVRKVIEDFDFLWSTVSLPQTIRCLFETHRKSTNHRTYLLVQVMNKNLEMWRSTSTTTTTEPLVRFEGMKVLFQVIDNRAADGQDISVVVPPVPPLILSWENDSTVNHIRISDDMIDEAIRRLEERADCIPRVYQRIGGNGFRLSYLYDLL